MQVKYQNKTEKNLKHNWKKRDISISSLIRWHKDLEQILSHAWLRESH